jgi:hypothetical protein
MMGKYLICARSAALAAGLFLTLAPASAVTAAQRVPPTVSSGSATPEALKRDVERRFDVLMLRDGLVLRPKSPGSTVKAIEVTNGAIAVDGDGFRVV